MMCINSSIFVHKHFVSVDCTVKIVWHGVYTMVPESYHNGDYLGGVMQSLPKFC